LKFYLSGNFKGEGISEGIKRGILVDCDNYSIVQEGLGLGAPAIKTKNGTYFSCRSKITKISEEKYVQEFDINTQLVWEIFGVKLKNLEDSNLLTVFINKLTDFYKRLPYFQSKLLKIGIFSRNFFRTKSKIQHLGSLGKIIFYYHIIKNDVVIGVDFSHFMRFNRKPSSKICILNELGGDFFNYSVKNNKIYSPPSGWVKIKNKENTKLYSRALGLDFTVDIIEKNPNHRIEFIYGRERISNFCWAGFDIEIDVKSIKNTINSQKDCNLKYICRFSKRRELS
jgi:hypothetical protein